MNNLLKNILILVVALILSYLTADYFGFIYNRFSPPTDGSLLGLSDQAVGFITGIPFAYIFFIILLFKLFGLGNKNKWTGWLLVLPFLFFASGDLKHIYLPIVLALVALGLAVLLRKIFKISKHTEPSPR